MHKISLKAITSIIIACLSAFGQKEDRGEMPMLESLFTYEQAVDYDAGENYFIITGINDAYKDGFTEHMKRIADEAHKGSYWTLLPGDVYGIPVRKIGEGAFRGAEIDGLILPESIEVIGAEAFQNARVTEVCLPERLREIGEEAFAGCRLEEVRLPANPLTVKEGAFKRNPGLWKVLAPKADSVFEKDVFADCDSDFILCCGENPEENPVKKYAEENGFAYREIYLSDKPAVNYPENPLVLEPEVKGFFYGDDGDPDMDGFWDFRMQEDAPNFGFVDWHLPGCSTWCGCMGFEQEAEASSELEPESGRYGAENILVQNREKAWAEGVEGPGTGESITYRQSCKYSIADEFDAMSKYTGEVADNGYGFMRYSEICIVNGYAKNQKTWEENGRIKTLLMLVEGRPYARLKLEDTMMPQYFSLPEDDIKVLSGKMIEFRFVIEEVYPGSLYEDTCLTGIVMEFTGRFAH